MMRLTYVAVLLAAIAADARGQEFTWIEAEKPDAVSAEGLHKMSAWGSVELMSGQVLYISRRSL